MNIRKFVVTAERLDDLVELDTLTGHAASSLDAAVQAGLNVLVSGGTQDGKATLLSPHHNHLCGNTSQPVNASRSRGARGSAPRSASVAHVTSSASSPATRAPPTTTQA